MNETAATEPPAKAIDEDRVIKKLDNIEHMLERLTGPADPASPNARPLTKQAFRREKGLTHLYRDPRNGIFIWKRRDEMKGRSFKRSTKTRDEAFAIQLGAKFELDYQRRRAGLSVFDDYAKPLGPAIEHWVASLVVTDEVRRTMEMQIRRAVGLLKLSTFADLDDMQRLERNLLALEGRPISKWRRFTKLTLRVSVQKPLRQFSKWCAKNHRYLPVDPLADWDVLRVPDSLPRKRRRALAPAEMARALLAAKALDGMLERTHPTWIAFLGLLITGARFGAFSATEVDDLDRERSRIDLGEGVGKKRRGAATLDAKTLEEVLACLAERKDGPLFPSPWGERLDGLNLLDDWRAARALALVDELWPEPAPRDLEEMYLVSRVLLSKRVPNVGGNPLRLRAETRAAREARERRVRGIAETLREAWIERSIGVDLHALRKTHRTWSEASGVHPILIDKQLGHSTAAGGAALDMARSLLVSPTGRKHYVDMGLDLIDPQRSADAVRKLLDEATKTLLEAGETGLVRRSESGGGADAGMKIMAG